MHILPERDRGVSRRTAMKLGAAGAASLAIGTAHLRLALPAHAQEASPASGEAQVIVGDVLDFELAANGRWEGHFGSVTLTLHPGFYDGGDAWFIRTDASDADFAEANGLVYVPLLKNALDAEGSYGSIYLFDGGVDEQRPVVSTVPGQTTFTPAFQVHNVSFTGDTALMASEDAILEGAEAGTVDVEATGIIVNYPLVLWPDGGLEVDLELVNPLGPGALIEEPDLENGAVTFKLHQCYPGSRYIATDTSLEPMAQPMGVVLSEATQALIEVNATAPIYVFMPGLPGPAAMGGQPSVFNSTAGEGIWSPFWEHKTVAWNEGVEPMVLTNEAEVLEHEAAGDLTIFMGVPETDPVSFVVNCPAPVLAVNDYEPADFAAQATPEA
ncbi:MAG: hypothetical protein H0T72_08025 [Chloroflexia bacterium]|nr:hypothetical protein [Chloroflexia bacterium]